MCVSEGGGSVTLMQSEYEVKLECCGVSCWETNRRERRSVSHGNDTTTRCQIKSFLVNSETSLLSWCLDWASSWWGLDCLCAQNCVKISLMETISSFSFWKCLHEFYCCCFSLCRHVWNWLHSHQWICLSSHVFWVKCGPHSLAFPALDFVKI